MKRLIIFFSCLIATCEMFACTGMLIQARDRTAVSGRTVEFNMPLDFSLAVIPRNMSFNAQTPKGKGMSYTSKYAATGIYCFDDVVVLDGINEKGLVVGAFYFPGYSDYVKVTPENKDRALSPLDFSNWILTQFATLEEVKEAVKSVVITPTVFKNWGKDPPPMHYIVYDKSGKSIVIEPVDQTLKVYDNLLGTVTNSPTFDWQLTHLNCYINLNAYNADPKYLKGYQLTNFGQGTGLTGLPGDFTPPSRFVRAAFYSSLAIPPKDSDGCVNLSFHLLNQFDIPPGTVREKHSRRTFYDHTLLTSVKDPYRLRFYFRTYENQSIRFVDLQKFDPNGASIKHMKIEGGQKVFDISSQIK